MRWLISTVVVGTFLFFGASTFAATDYLIVTPDNLAPVAKAFSDYRKSKGYETQILPISKLYDEKTHYSSRAWIIRDAVTKIYQKSDKSKPFYLLIIGDTVSNKMPLTTMERVPCYYSKDNSEQTASVGRKDATIATDNFYGCVDFKDDIPEIAVGRVSVKTVKEGLAVLGKIKRYEASTKNGSWRRKLTFFASEGGFGVLDRLLEWLFTRMADQYIPYDFDLNMTYANPGSPYVYLPDRFSNKIIQRANEGSLILTYIGHGHDTVLDTLRWRGRRYPILTYKDLDKIQCQGRYPIFFVVACFTGRYDRGNDTDCIAEKLLKNEKGPSAILASSRISHPYSNSVLQKDFIDQVCRKRIKTIGEAMRRAKAAMCLNFDRQRRQLELFSVLMVPKKERVELARTHCSMYNLFGDPAMIIQMPDKLLMRLTKSKDGQGKKTLKVLLPEDAVGQALVTLESERSTILRPVLKTLPEDLSTNAARELVKQSYRNANNKVVRSWKVEVKDGQLVWPKAPDLTLPQISGKYYVKVYAWGKGWQKAGSLPLGELPRSVGKGYLPEEKKEN